jgi:hypothetical protein
MGYFVMCRVSGGVTGTREALLKENGVVVRFETREAAQAEVNRLMKQDDDRRREAQRYGAHRADFGYWVEEG